MKVGDLVNLNCILSPIKKTDLMGVTYYEALPSSRPVSQGNTRELFGAEQGIYIGITRYTLRARKAIDKRAEYIKHIFLFNGNKIAISPVYVKVVVLHDLAQKES